MKSKIIFISLLLLVFFSIPLSMANAGTCKKGVETGGPCQTTVDCTNTNYAGYTCDTTNPATSGTVSLPNPITIPDANKANPIPYLLGIVINSVLGIVGSLALVMFIYGGITWMLSAGNQEQVTKGKNILIWAAAGIVIIFTAYALVKFVLTTVTGTGG
ncbi:MAG: pilin [Patescibacteria group bacterium]|nr:pilin [Patescibacteria group bacterium]